MHDDKEEEKSQTAGVKEGFQINDEFMTKIASLVTKNLQPRLPETIWNNYNLSTPNTAVAKPSKTTAPQHYDNTKSKDDENDLYGNILLLSS